MTEMLVARQFYPAHPRPGPAFAPDHPTMADGPVRDWVLSYLSAGPKLLIAVDLLPDVVDPERGRVVPANVRTDGTWLWTDLVVYYLREYDLAPDPGLLRHVEAQYTLPSSTVDVETLSRAVGALGTPRGPVSWPRDEPDE